KRRAILLRLRPPAWMAFRMFRWIATGFTLRTERSRPLRKQRLRLILSARQILLILSNYPSNSIMEDSRFQTRVRDQVWTMVLTRLTLPTRFQAAKFRLDPISTCKWPCILQPQPKLI